MTGSFAGQLDTEWVKTFNSKYFSPQTSANVNLARQRVNLVQG